jgi:hypothetical protein
MMNTSRGTHRGSHRRASAIQVLAAVALAFSTGISAKAASATADNSNSATTFGPPIINTVVHGGSYAGITTTVTAVTGSGGSDAGGTNLFLAGFNNGANGGGTASVSQAWRTRLTSETSGATTLVSDVLNLTGLETSGNTTDPYVLQLNFNTGLVTDLPTLIANQRIFLASQDAGGKWVNTVGLNTGNVVTSPLDNRYGYHGSYAAFQADPLGGNGGTPGSELGAWGVDTFSGDQVWAVVNHNSTFTVTVPEPGTAALCAAGAAMLLRRRRRSA